MTTQELHRAVARRTGETPGRIARQGFQLIAERQAARPDFQSDPEAYGVDWDARPRGVDVFPPLRKRPAV